MTEPTQQQALEEDLELATRIQVALRPPQDVGVAGRQMMVVRKL